MLQITDPLWGESTGQWWTTFTKANNAESVSVLWRHPTQAQSCKDPIFHPWYLGCGTYCNGISSYCVYNVYGEERIVSIEYKHPFYFGVLYFGYLTLEAPGDVSRFHWTF